MPGSCVLAIFNNFIVVPAPGELSCTYSENLKLKHQSVTFLGEILASNTTNVGKPDLAEVLNEGELRQ